MRAGRGKISGTSFEVDTKPILRDVTFSWPAGFRRIPDQPWVTSPLETLALKYDTVESHGWYANLEPTLEQLERELTDGDICIDYSGGTGILVDRLFKRVPDVDAGFVIVDASPKFLRLAVEKLRNDARVAFRWIRYKKEERCLEQLHEVLESPLDEAGVDLIVSTNAIHLYYGLADTLASWTRALKPDGLALVQSGNIRNPDAEEHEWIIDETVGAIHRVAQTLVRDDDAYAAYRPGLEDAPRMEKYDALRAKYFIPVRPLDYYTGALETAGLKIAKVEKRTIVAHVQEWYDFLAVYHEGVLGWVGGVERIEGEAATEAAVQDRLRLIRAAMDQLFERRETFDACWTYVTCRR